MARSSKTMLEALSKVENRLPEDTHAAFREMRDGLNNGFRSLTPRQYEWVQDWYLRLELDSNEPAQNLVSSGVVKKSSGTVMGYEMLPRPLRPPGRGSTDG